MNKSRLTLWLWPDQLNRLGELILILVTFSVALISAVVSSPSSAALVRYDAGTAIGIDNVFVDGAFYNATFVDDPIDPLLTPLYDYQFALNASVALRDLLEGDFSGSDFDYYVAQTLGCTSGLDCYMATPYLSNGVDSITAWSAINSGSLWWDGNNIGIQALNVDNTLYGYFTTTVVWTSVSAVPIPAAIWLFGSGLLGLVGMARRKKA